MKNKMFNIGVINYGKRICKIRTSTSSKGVGV